MEIASETTSLTWWDLIVGKVITKTNESMWSLDQYDLAYTMKLYEYVTLQEYIESLYNYDRMQQIENEKRLQKASRLGA